MSKKLFAVSGAQKFKKKINLKSYKSILALEGRVGETT
jgi:hypothetical protein